MLAGGLAAIGSSAAFLRVPRRNAALKMLVGGFTAIGIMDPDPDDPKASSTSRKAPRIATAIALLLGLIAATPALLSTELGKPILAKLITSGVGVPADFSSASVRWRGPIVLHEVSIPSPDSFGQSTMATAAEVQLDASFASWFSEGRPRAVRIDGLFLELIEKANGETNLGEALRPWRSADGSLLDGGALSLSSTNGVIRITRATHPLTPTMLSPVAFSLNTRKDGTADSAAFSAGVEGNAGSASLRFEFSSDPSEGGDTRTLDLGAENAQLGPLQPLLRVLYPGAVIAGLAQGTARVQRSEASLDLLADASVIGFQLEGTPFHHLPMRDNRVRLEGSARIDLARREAHFDHFKIASTSFGIDANGQIRMSPDGLTGDLALNGSMDFLRTSRRIAPALTWIPPGYGFGGDVIFDLALREDGRLDASVDGEAGSFSTPNGSTVGLGDWNARSLIAVTPSQQTISIDECVIHTFAGTIDGNVHARNFDPTPGEYGGDLRFSGESSKLLKLLSPWLTGIPMGLVGPGEVRVAGNAGPDEAHFRTTIVSDDLDVRVDYDTPEISDLYWVRGAPLNAELDIRWPRSGDFVRDLSATFKAHAEEAWIRLDPMLGVNAELTMSAGVARIHRLSMSGYDGGSLSATGSLSFTEDSPTLDVAVRLDDVLLKNQLLDHVARPIPIFAAKPNPFSIQTTCRGSGDIRLRAVGKTMTEWFRTMVGDANISIGSGTIEGSPLLSALQRTSDPVRCDRISATITMAPSSIRSEARIEIAGRSPVRLIGAASPTGSLEFRIPPKDVLPSDVLPELSDVVTPDLFPVRGRVTDPIFRLPDETFYELDEPGNMREYLLSMKSR